MSGTKTDPSEITIRPARREDIRRVASLIMLGAATQTLTPAEIEAEAAHPSYEHAFDEIAASPDNTLFVAEREGEVIGTFQVTLIPGIVSRGRKRAKFESVHVAPECRGMGIGAVMIAFAIDFAKGRGAEVAELTSNKSRLDAHRFYRNLGFDQSHEGFKIVV
ncbi:GNAT family N-acetyltransferase [Bosea caraganae]|uniref:GNAT family N-acetyltransferase n=1 Tax=Bosea caraganae TaxID=2763117 RepID=A0A370L1S6_9HYPH|nr:GNAT family N-acetyltransferase [Bosea caraganae]RDJ21497.1 GNAT family N-acetyltransferase [Bosea caraganae]RDJ23465.1 GNAT family N-acetyltransferase [Bosea caraganae]